MTRPSVGIGFKTPSFGLTHQFLAASALTIAVSMGLLAFVISQRIEASMMQTAAEEGALFTEVFLGPSAQDLATSRSLSPESLKKLDDLLAGKLGERVKLIKIWLPDATLVYSTNGKESVGDCTALIRSPNMKKPISAPSGRDDCCITVATAIILAASLSHDAWSP